LRYNADDRGQRYCDIFPEIEKGGDINVTVIEPGASALWHRHRFQADWQLVVKGALKIGVANLPNDDIIENEAMWKLRKQWDSRYSEVYSQRLSQFLNKDHKNVIVPTLFSKDKARCDWFYMSERNACEGPLYIPTGLWHGCHNYTNEPAILIYHITAKWDGTDEDRASPEVMGWPYERIVK
jgi:hypothetical protein